MQQYFVESNQTVERGDHLDLGPQDSYHLVKVLRGQIGQEVIVVLGDQKYFARLVKNDQDCAQVEIVQALKPSLTQTELPVEVVIACGLSKQDKIEQIVQKATECGMTAFQPLALKRDVVKWDQKKAQTKRSRLEKIAQAAAEQSKRLIVPEIAPLKQLSQWVADQPEDALCLYAYEEKAKEGDHAQLKVAIRQLQPGQKVRIVFGSEGGFDPEEAAYLEAHGFRACSLGPRILRAETAPIYALSAISYALEL